MSHFAASPLLKLTFELNMEMFAFGPLCCWIFFEMPGHFSLGVKRIFKVIMAGFKFLRERKDEWLIRVQGGEAKHPYKNTREFNYGVWSHFAENFRRSPIISVL